MLLTLLPYSKDFVLNTVQDRVQVIRLITFIARLGQASIDAYLGEQYAAFSAEMNENLCPIQAYQVLLFVKSHTIEECERLKAFREAFKGLGQMATQRLDHYAYFLQDKPSQYIQSMHMALSLKDFLAMQNFECPGDEKIAFLVQLFVLSRYVSGDCDERLSGLNNDKLCDGLADPSPVLISQWIRHLQRNVSKHASQFVFSLLYDTGADYREIFMLQKLYFQDEAGRDRLPSYAVTKLLLSHAKSTQTRIKLVVHRKSRRACDRVIFLFAPDQRRDHFHCDLLAESHSEPVLTFEGRVQDEDLHQSVQKYRQRLIQVGLETIVLANMAQRPQYASPHPFAEQQYNPYQSLVLDDFDPESLDFYRRFERDFLYHKALAYKLGCCREKPQLFLLTRVYCDTGK